MGIVNNIVLDSEGNKYLNLGDTQKNDEKQIGNNLSNYEPLQILSDLNIGVNVVVKVRSLDNNKIYSLKKFKNSVNNNFLIQTLEELKSLNNPNIMKYYKYFIENSNIYLLMEYCNNSDIQSYIVTHNKMNRNIPEVEIWNILLQCLSGLYYLSKINNDNNTKIKLKIIDIFINNDQNIKLGVFSDNMNNNQNDLNYYERLNLYFLSNILNMMINPIFANTNNIQQNFCYSSELKNIVNNMLYLSSNNNNEKINMSNIFDNVKNEYSTIYNKNSSIQAVLESFYLYQYFNMKLINQRNKIESNKDKFFINNLYLTTIDSIYKNNFQTFNLCIQEFRRAIALSYSKLVSDSELDPLLVLTFILDRLHKENNNEINIQNNKENDYEQESNIGIYTFNEQEEDKTNKILMLDKFVTNFNSTFNSPISDLFISFYKTEHTCLTCKAKFFNFSNCLYVTFDLSKRNSNSNFDLIKDGFEAQHNNIVNKNSEKNDNIICERCLTYRQFEEKKSYYLLNRHLIICFIRGKRYNNYSQIIYDNNIDLKKFIDTSDNSPYQFYFVGSINRIYNNNKEQFISKKQQNNNIQNLQQNEQIIILFYNSKDNIN